jgi:hypothetical protein
LFAFWTASGARRLRDVNPIQFPGLSIIRKAGIQNWKQRLAILHEQ